MVEEMYQQEAKEESPNEQDWDQSSGSAQTPTPNATTSTTAITPSPPKEINAHDNDPSFIAINRQPFSDNQSKPPQTAASSTVAHSFAAMHDEQGSNADVGPTLIRFGTSSGDVSLTLGLRHAGNLPEKSQFSVRDFGGC